MTISRSIVLALCLLVCTPWVAEGEQEQDDPDKKSVTNRRLCSEGEYYDREDRMCRRCSECPENLHLLRVCSDQSNTYCGPLKFIFKSLVSGTYTVLKSDGEDDDGEEEITPKTTKASQIEQLKFGTWHTISLVLLGILSIAFLFLTLYIVVTCYLHKHRHQGKPYSYNSVAFMRFRTNEQTTDERYIRDPTTPRHIPARERLKPSVEAGGQDSAGPSHIFIPSLGVRQSRDADPDNGAQSGSAEYVYIKKVKDMSVSPFNVV